MLRWVGELELSSVLEQKYNSLRLFEFSHTLFNCCRKKDTQHQFSLRERLDDFSVTTCMYHCTEKPPPLDNAFTYNSLAVYSADISVATSKERLVVSDVRPSPNSLSILAFTNY